MEIICPNCQKCYTIDDTRIPANVKYVKCKSCEYRFLINKVAVDRIKSNRVDELYVKSIIKSLLTHRIAASSLIALVVIISIILLLDFKIFISFGKEENRADTQINNDESYHPIKVGNPQYIKQITSYHEGDGIVLYIILADKYMHPIACDGWIYISITLNDDTPVYSNILKVKSSDFQCSYIGKGPYKEKTILFSLGRISYATLERTMSAEKEINCIKARDPIQMPGSKVREYCSSAMRVLSGSLNGEIGKVEVGFLHGAIPSKLLDSITNKITHEMSYREFLDFSFTVSASKITSIRKAQEEKLKEVPWDFKEGKESFIF